MKYAICKESVSPLRAENSDKSEMVSQLLFGEKVTILEEQKKWIYLKNDFDGYEGWADPKQYFLISEQDFHALMCDQFARDLYNLSVMEDLPKTLTIGAHLNYLHGKLYTFGEQNLEYHGESIQPEKSRENMVEIAFQYLNVPYLWGGKSSFGIDCSGFTQQVYKMCDVKLPRDASQQAEKGEVLSFVEEALPGDLAFFDNEEGQIIHVGIVLENQKIIHAHGKVRIDLLDSTGIFNTDSQSYSHKLRFIKTFL